ncbi:DUF4433 domain-containing protein [bacterium]|nr:MAG: DUF4433 domain-containing protein [bacterium]
MPRKPDTVPIQNFLKQLKEQTWLGPARSWWPDYVFRFDDIENVSQILNSGKILSRREIAKQRLIHKDCASPEVLSSTSDKWKDYVRLYFRPRTPTQYDGEGFRAKQDYKLGAHFPVPIVMLFDASDILTRDSTKYSNGNLAADANTGDNIEFLKTIPFNKVYHDTWFNPGERSTIIFHRHAEVIVPNELDLTALKFIGCRTQAEYETLIHLLSTVARKQLLSKIGLGTKMNLHNRRWTFIEQASMSTELIRFQFNPSSLSPGPFWAKVQIEENATGDVYSWEDRSYNANAVLKLSINSMKDASSYKVTLTLDGNIAYKNSFEVAVPF